SAAAAADAVGLARAGDVHDEGAAAEVLAGQGADRGLGFVVVGHLDEPEAAGAAGFAVHDHARPGDLAVLGEELVEFILGGRVREVAHVNVGHERRPSACGRGAVPGNGVTGPAAVR